MSTVDESVADENMVADLEAVLADLQTIEEYLPEPLTLTEAIAELEATIAVYEQTELGA